MKCRSKTGDLRGVTQVAAKTSLSVAYIDMRNHVLSSGAVFLVQLTSNLTRSGVGDPTGLHPPVF
jgi:hypothetical protein